MKKLFSIKLLVGILALFVAILACGAPIVDIPFHFVATYQANLSAYQIDIDAQGVVPAGHDITTDGTAHVEITSLSVDTIPDLTIDIDAKGSATVLVDGNPERSFNWYRRPQGELRQLFEEVGYQTLLMGEIDETVRVINGAKAGSKGVVLEGQTKWLEVVDIQSQR